MAEIRLDRYLADAGQGTRSEVKLLIKKGRVKIGDAVVKKPEQKVKESDLVFVDGNAVSYKEFEYYMLHKPAGVVSATTDKKDKTVIELIKEDKRRDLFPVGRLDKDTEGLLLITNDGKLANELLSPKKHVSKTYYAVVDGVVDEETQSHFKEGVDIGDDELTKPAVLTVCEKQISDRDFLEYENISHVRITITEGRYHQIKRMFNAVGMNVLYLKRLSMGSLVLDEALPRGSYRCLTEKEIETLKKGCRIDEG